MNSIFSDNLRGFEVFIYLALFLGLLLVFEGLRQSMGGVSGVAEAKNRRMRMIRKGIAPEQIELALLRGQSHRGSRFRGPLAQLRRALSRSGLTIGVQVVIAGSIALSLLLSGFLTLVFSAPLAAIIGVGIGMGLPFAVIDRLAGARMAKLTTQLPDALDMIIRGLRVGHPLNVALRRVASEMPDPIGTEFGLIEDQVRHGADIATAFNDFADRVDTEDARYLAVCVGIQHGTGGNLARVLGVLSRVIRDRMNMRKKITAISAEGRLSAMILSLMPFIIFGTIYSSTPTFYTDVMDHPVFLPVAVIVVGLVVLQGLVLRRITSFEF